MFKLTQTAFEKFLIILQKIILSLSQEIINFVMISFIWKLVFMFYLTKIIRFILGLSKNFILLYRVGMRGCHPSIIVWVGNIIRQKWQIWLLYLFGAVIFAKDPKATKKGNEICFNPYKFLIDILQIFWLISSPCYLFEWDIVENISSS